MSVRAQSQVWQYSKAKGGPLLVLLAIADYAHDDGRNAWPAMTTLAKKTRMTERAVRFILRQLESLHEIRIRENTARIEVNEGFVPRRFIDVLCVKKERSIAASPEKIAGDQGESAETLNDSTDVPLVAEKISGGAPEKISGGKILQPGGKNSAARGEKSRTALKEEPLLDPLLDPKTLSPSASASVFALTTPADSDQAADQHRRRQFERLVHIYPRQAALAAAWKEFQRLNPTDAVVALMLEQIERHKCTVWGAVEPRFIPHLRTWLHQRRWEDGEDISPVSEKELGVARKRLSQAYNGHCPHHPRCETVIGCLKEIALRERTHAEQEHRRAS